MLICVFVFPKNVLVFPKFILVFPKFILVFPKYVLASLISPLIYRTYRRDSSYSLALSHTSTYVVCAYILYGKLGWLLYAQALIPRSKPIGKSDCTPSGKVS